MTRSEKSKGLEFCAGAKNRLGFKTSGSPLSIAAFALALAVPSTAYAQTAPGQAGDNLDEPPTEVTLPDEAVPIVVTGTRTASGFQAPTPLSIVGSEAIEERAATTLGEVLQQIPSFGPADSPNTAGVTSRGGGQINPDLRALGSNRTLVLVNGRRHVPTAATGSVDIKIIPTLLVEQVEVVTGGASAAYGSDAVAGVVNFILKDRIEGVEGTFQYGVSQRGDGEEYRGSLAAGTEFGGGRGRAVIGVDYLKIGGIDDQRSRDWGREEVGLITNPNFATNGLANFIISPDVRSANTTPGGLIVSGPLRGTAFGPGGVPFQYEFGQVFGSAMIGGSGELDNENLLALLGTPIESINGLARIEYEVSDGIEVFTELSASWSETLGASQENRDRGNLVIQQDNAFLPESVRQAMIDNSLSTITIGRVANDIGRIQLDRDNTMIRGVIGIEGRLSDSWDFDAYYQYGRNEYALEFGPNNRRQNEYRLAVDAVEVGGEIVCRSTLTNPDNGCIPVNVFGPGSLELNDYVFGSAFFDLLTTQHVAAANVRGEPFSTAAGAVAVAFGAEYRRDKASGDSDPVSQRPNPNGSIGGFILGNQLPINGTVEVFETYAEALVPLLSEQPGVYELNINAAGRRTDYSTSGVVYTWKVGGTYMPYEDLRFRATISRDIRAPNITELFESGGSSNTNVFDPALDQTIQVRELNEANPNLTPEIADTITAGFVFQPSFAPGLAFSADYWDITIEDAIGTIGAPVLAQGCFAGNQSFCDQITFNPNGSIAFITNSRLNLASVETSGIDFELTYRVPVDALDGTIQLRALATRTLELLFENPNGSQNRLGQVSEFNRTPGVPKWSGNVFLGYEGQRFGMGLQARYVGAGVFCSVCTEGAGAVRTVNDNSVPAYVYLTLSASYDLDVGEGQSLELFGVINNLLDTDPPFIPSGAAGGVRESSTNPLYYDVVGRLFRVGARFKF